MLKDFYLNESMKVEVHNYLIKFFEQEALKKVFEKEETKHLAEAKEIIDKAFENLEVLFHKKSSGKEIENPAR